MRKKKIIYIIPLLFIIALLGFKSDVYFQISKSFDIFSSIYRLIYENYVLEIDTKTLIKNGIDGMLKSLDPYTEYYDEEDTENLEYFASGSYTGLGITVSVIDSQLTITGIKEDYPAYKSGIKVGDRIYRIDNNIVINIDTEKLKDYTRGEQGSNLQMYVINNNNDTILHSLNRETIKMDNISYYEAINNQVAYIKLDRFTRTSASDIKKAIYDMRHNDQIKGMILDLRDNPGGLLDASVNVAELFLPENSLVVSTKRRNLENSGEYYTYNKPLEPDIPLCIIINENTASASEIVAGAIQDYDRGIIVGNKSFGKGLVQSIFDVPYNGHLKITTSKYYTPSGRCIQRLDFAEKYKGKIVQNSKDTIQYHTKNGRKVFDLNGILPDSIINNEIDNPIFVDFYNNFIFFKFAKYYIKINNLKNLDNIQNDNELYNSFINYINHSDIKYTNNIFSSLENVKNELKTNNSMKKSLESLKLLELEIKKELLNELPKYKSELLYQIKYELYLRFYKEKKIAKIMIENDPIIKKSINILLSDNYKKLLSPSNQ